MPKLAVDVLAGLPGSGKTEKMILDAAQTPGRYLFAAPTIDLLEEQAARFRSAQRGARCVCIHSKAGRSGKVERQIADLPKSHSAEDHVAAFITHEALMDTDLSCLVGWHARIDEAPNAISCGRINLAQSAAAFRDHFDLEALAGGWSKLTPMLLNESWKSFANDAMWKGLADFRKLAARPQGVCLNIEDWADLEREELQWFSLWTPLELRDFESVTIAGAGFLTSTAYRVMQSTFADELRFRVSHAGSARPAQPQVRIHYFTQAHRGSTTFWGESEGRRCLVAIERWLSANASDLGFWSGNSAVRHSMEHRIPGIMTLPKVAGLNRYREAMSCAFFYSSKPLPDDAALKSIFELTDDDMHDARESEDIFQFAMRGAIRDPTFNGAYDIYLYSLDQAERLRERLIVSGLPYVELLGVHDAGIMEIARAGRFVGKDIAAVDPASRAAKKREDNARRNRELRARKKAAKACQRQSRGGGSSM